jgi:hypothetical protein
MIRSSCRQIDEGSMRALDEAPPGSWHDAAAYRWCHALDRAGFAWEFLRRNAAYRSLARAAALERRSAGAILLGATSARATAWGLAFRRG